MDRLKPSFNKTIAAVGIVCISFGYLIQVFGIPIADTILFLLAIAYYPILTVTTIVTAILAIPSWFQEAQIQMFNGTYCPTLQSCVTGAWNSGGVLHLLPAPSSSPVPVLQTGL